jgi:hypothetical protein
MFLLFVQAAARTLPWWSYLVVFPPISPSISWSRSGLSSILAVGSVVHVTWVWSNKDHDQLRRVIRGSRHVAPVERERPRCFILWAKMVEVLKPGAGECTWRRGIGVWHERDVDLGFGALPICSSVVCFSSLSFVFRRRRRSRGFILVAIDSRSSWISSFVVGSIWSRLYFFYLIFLTIYFFRL